MMTFYYWKLYGAHNLKMRCGITAIPMLNMKLMYTHR